MSTVVVDTNVLLVANGMAAQMSDGCRLKCLERLQRAHDGEAVVVDRQFLILGEYQNKLIPNRRPPGPGDAFVRYLLQNMANATRVAPVNLTPTNNAKTEFAEFPKDAELHRAFDPADRKFVAASNAHPEKPPILESADSKWLAWEARLLSHGINVEFICRQELETIRQRKSASS
jgi:hypothetical protein